MLNDVIGGEFAVSIDGDSIQPSIHESRVDEFYASGRTALFAILDFAFRASKSGKKLLLPNYICKSVVDCALHAGADCVFYRVNSDMKPDLEDLLDKAKDVAAVILVNYFGMVSTEDAITRLKERELQIKIIVDDVQNYYGFKLHDGVDYSFTSYRKWFPVPDGAEVIYSGDKNLVRYEEPNRFYQYKLAGNLLKNFDEILSPEIYLESIETGESMLDRDFTGCISEYSLNRMNRIDKTEMAKRRRSNAKILHDGLSDLGVEHIWNNDEGIIPLFVPIIIKKGREKLRSAFAKENIFCPVHWPKFEIGGIPALDNSLYDNEMSLICDFRYGDDSMYKQLRIIERECKNL